MGMKVSPQPEAFIPIADPVCGFDPLTGLWRREPLLRLLFPETDRVQRMGTPMALLLLDIDGFARVNEQHGRDAGDRVLQQFAVRLRRFLRSYDLVGRVGGDEFLVALPGCHAFQARALASRIRTVMLRRPFPTNGEMAVVTASIGLARSRGRSPLVVLREAEQALAAAKQAGCDCEREYRPAMSSPAAPENGGSPSI